MKKEQLLERLNAIWKEMDKLGDEIYELEMIVREDEIKKSEE